MKSIKEIFPQSKVIVIAEIGLNHNGDPALAKSMIDAAHHSGADAVKFQTFVPGQMNSSYTKSLLEDGIEGAPDNQEKVFFEKHSLSYNDISMLFKHSLSLGIEFISSPFDIESVEILEKTGVRIYKIASSEVTNHILLEAVAKTRKPVIMSTGISTENEIAMAIDCLSNNGTPEIFLLHCISLYPTPNDKINLNRIKTLKERFNLQVGYSDHTPDYRAVELAIASGALVIEKHLTLDYFIDCPDKAVSLDPKQFTNMINSINNIVSNLGSGQLSYTSAEKSVALSARKSLFARRDISAGTILCEDDIIAKRPGLGIPVYQLHEILGKRCIIDIKSDHLIRKENLE